MTPIGRGRLLGACPAPVVAKEMRAGRDLHGLTQDALQMICPSGKTSRILLRSCIWPASKSVARKLRFGQAFQRDLGRPVCCAEINRSACRANHRYNLSPSHPSEGRFAIVTDAGWDAVDAAASGAKRVRRAASRRERTTARKMNDADAYGKTVWSRHPLLVPSCAEAASTQPSLISR